MLFTWLRNRRQRRFFEQPVQLYHGMGSSTGLLAGILIKTALFAIMNVEIIQSDKSVFA